MRALVVLMTLFGAVAVAGPALATVYVPGHYKDGIYVRPHFLDFPGQAVGGPLLLPPDQQAAREKEQAADRFEFAPVPRKRPPLPAS